jgi:outer membrane murein-binding lipoprotein Lpp
METETVRSCFGFFVAFSWGRWYDDRKEWEGGVCMGGNRDDFSTKTKDIMAKQVAFRCSNPNCRKLTCGSGTKKDGVVNIGVAAHICAAAPGGKRYDPNMTPEQRKDIDNGIWLCQSCAKLIDSDEIRYPVELLRKWKIQAMEETARELEFRSGEGKEHILALGNFAKTVSECKTLEDFLRCEAFLNGELDKLVEKMEKLQQKIDYAQSRDNRFWSGIYERQLDNNGQLFRQIDAQIKMMREQADSVRRGISLGEAAVQSAAGAAAGMIIGAVLMPVGAVAGALAGVGMWMSVQKKVEQLASMLRDAWSMADQAESSLAWCDTERKRVETLLSEENREILP